MRFIVIMHGTVEADFRPYSIQIITLILSNSTITQVIDQQTAESDEVKVAVVVLG